MDFDALVKARKVLSIIWDAALLKGRCWGPKKEGNPFRASNITMGNEESLVSICQLPDGSLRIHEFCKTIGGTSLGRQVRKTLVEAGLVVKD